MANKEREQKRMAPEGSPWDPEAQAKICLYRLRADVDRCDPVGSIAHTGCVYGNAEAAFYEDIISEADMVSMKEEATELRHNFSSKCKCQPIQR